jgi:hypothetical protein
MARFQDWFSQFVRRQPGHGNAAGAALAWRVTPPADPTQPLWLVPAYQRQRRSGDRLLPR